MDWSDSTQEPHGIWVATYDSAVLCYGTMLLRWTVPGLGRFCWHR